jgi:type IV pilus assembly protein PilY1
LAVGERVTGATSGATGVVEFTDGVSILLKNVEGRFCFGETISGHLGGSAWMSQLGLTSAGDVNNSTQHRDALNAPLVVDLDADQKADQIYVGNMYGTLYRVKNIGKGLHPHVTKLFEFDPLPAGPNVNPIRGKATFAWSEVNGNIWVYWGTGIYEQAADQFSRDQQYVFGVKDALNVPAGDSPPARPYRLNDLVPLETKYWKAAFNGKTRVFRYVTGTNPTSAPWVLKLDVPGGTMNAASERLFTKPVAVGGVLLFTTFRADENTCSGTGDTWLYALDYKTGLAPEKPVFDLNKDGKFNDADKIEINGVRVVPAGIFIGRGKPSHPVLHKDTIYITTATQTFDGVAPPEDENLTGLHTIEVNLPQLRIRMESWKHD